MPRLIGSALLTALTVATLLACGSQALASHVQCGDVITQDTTLDSDVIDCPGDGIVIGASDITLDLAGHTVDGDGIPGGAGQCDMGIANIPFPNLRCLGPFQPGTGHEDVTIRGGTVREFDVGAMVGAAARAELRDLSVSRNRPTGIVVTNSDGAMIRENRVFDNLGEPGIARGIVAVAASRLVIEGNEVSGHDGTGIEADGLDDSRIEGNRLLGNQSGLHLHSAHRSVITRNLSTGNETVGIEVSEGVFDNLVSRNTASHNGDVGILVFDGAHGNRVERNRVYNNAPEDDFFHYFRGGIVVDAETQVRGNSVSGNVDGIVLCCGSDNVAEQNRVTGNRKSGVFLGSDGSTLRRNRLSHNGTHGVEQWESRLSRIERNVISHNGEDGIFGRALHDMVVKRNVVSANGRIGLNVGDGMSGTLLADNRVLGNGGTGIHMEEGAHENRVVGNTVLRNAHSPHWREYTAGGIFVGHGDRNEISGNRLSANGGLGTLVLAYSNRDNVITSNHLDRNSGDGIVIAYASANLVEANRVSRNGGDGIYLEADARGNLVRRNFAVRNADDGMDSDSAFTTFTHNTGVSNADFGIEAAPGVTDGGGNRASGNGNPLQCLNVACR